MGVGMRPFLKRWNFSRICLMSCLMVSINAEIAVRDLIIPAVELAPTKLGRLMDDGGFDTMMTALRRQEAAFNRRNLNDQLIIAGQSYPMSVLKDTLTSFRQLWLDRKSCIDQGLGHCQTDFEKRMKEDYRWYRPLVKGRSDAHFTGYYSPTFYAKQKSRGDFRYGLYRKPKNQGDLAYSRNDILFNGSLEGKGLELFYMNDPYELFLLHVEGGGVVETMENGKKKSYFLSYEGTNGQSFSFIGPYMRDQGYIPNVSVKEQRKYLKKNPDKWEEIYGQTPSYVFMKITKTEPLGMENIPLTSGRSMAQDRKIYWRKGIMGFINTKIPDFSRRSTVGAKTPMSRFFIDQDTGGAIKGEARADLYWGYGTKAKFLAENLDDYGDLVFFIKKN